MEYRHLHVTVISASDLVDVRSVHTMNPFVVASLSGDEGRNREQQTPVHEGGGTSPRWDHDLAAPFNVDLAAALNGRLTLKLKIKTKRTGRSDKDVGGVDVPVQELLELGGDGMPKEKTCPVKLPESESAGGDLKLSFKFGEPSPVREGEPHQPPEDQQPPKAGGRGNKFRKAMSRATWILISSAMSAAMAKLFS